MTTALHTDTALHRLIQLPPFCLPKPPKQLMGGLNYVIDTICVLLLAWRQTQTANYLGSVLIPCIVLQSYSPVLVQGQKRFKQQPLQNMLETTTNNQISRPSALRQTTLDNLWIGTPGLCGVKCSVLVGRSEAPALRRSPSGCRPRFINNLSRRCRCLGCCVVPHACTPVGCRA